MKTPIKKLLSILFSLFVVVLASGFARAQCTYITVRDGNLSDPSIYAQVLNGCPKAPSGTGTIVINNKVILDQNFTLTSGSLTINATGSLSQPVGGSQTLTIGNKGNGGIVQLTIVASTLGVRSQPQLSVSVLDLSKTIVNIGSGAVVQVGCTVLIGTQVNINLGNNALLNVLGNVDVATGSSGVAGPSNSGTPAGVRVYSNLVDNKGGAKSLFESGTNLIVCVQGNPLANGCTPTSTAIFDIIGSGVVNDVSCFSVLPVTLTSFVASRMPTGNAVELSWTTASELNNAFFAVERSTDGRAFAVVGQIAGAGTSNTAHHYIFTDESLVQVTSYYRLRQMDLDGSASYSPVATVAGRRATTDWLIPTASRHYKVQGGAGGQLMVLDILGKVLFTQPIATDNAAVEVPALPTGVYLFQLVTAQGRYTVRQALASN